LLTPEKNVSAEAGVNYQISNYWNIDGAVFQNEFYDYIEAGIDAADGLVVFKNLTRARIQGAEINSTVKFFSGNLILNVNYTYLNSRDLNTKKALKYRPRHMSYSNITYRWNNIEIGAAFRFWSRVEEIDTELLNIIRDADLRTDVKVLDLSAGINLVSSGMPAGIHFNANNIFNYNYVELIGNLAPIRNFSLSVELFF
jgi:outer membrane receptor for ferrienterochelin and colicin